jgi:hypothetical protein
MQPAIYTEFPKKGIPEFHSGMNLKTFRNIVILMIYSKKEEKV